MALIVKDRVKETTETTGTGTLTLAGAQSGFQSFAVIGNGNTTYYAVVDTTNNEWEVGLGTYTASGTTLSRDTILESSNSGSAVNFQSGTKFVFCTQPAEKTAFSDDIPTAVSELTNDAGYITGISANSVGASELNVSGNGTTTQFLRSDGDGTFTWATPTDTNTTYSAGTGITLTGTTFSNAAPDQTVSLTGSGATSVSGTYPNFTISSTDTNTTYSTATSGTLGLVKIGYTESGKNYPVELSNGQMYVNVPWTDTDTVYSLPEATSTTRGGIELFSDTDQSVAANTVTTTAGRTYGIQLNSNGQAVVNVPWVNTDTNTTYSAGTALDLSGTTFNVDLSELSTSTTNGDGDYFVVVDTSNVQRKLTKGNIAISGFSNDAGYTTNVGDITGVTAGTNLSGGGTSGTVTLNMSSTPSLTSVTLGSGCTLQESTDRADLLQITSSTSSWAGLQIRNSSNEGRWSFMTDGATAGFYDDEQGDWAIQMTENGSTILYYNGTAYLTTVSGGINVTGDIYVDDQIIHDGDTNTYMQFPSADNWRVVTGGTERLVANNSYVYVNQSTFYADMEVASKTGSVAMGLGLYNHFYWTLTGNITILNPSVEQIGMCGVFIFKHSGSARTVSLSSKFKTVGGAGLTLSSTANAVDVVPYIVTTTGTYGQILLGNPILGVA